MPGMRIVFSVLYYMSKTFFLLLAEKNKLDCLLLVSVFTDVGSWPTLAGHLTMSKLS